MKLVLRCLRIHGVQVVMTAWLIVHATTGGTTNVMAFVVGVLIVVALWFQIRELKHLYERRS